MKVTRIVSLVTTVLSFYLPAQGQELQFDSWMSYPTDRIPTSVYSADLDKDGDSDLVVCNRQLSTVLLMKNKGNGTFQRDTLLQATGGPTRVVAKDLDRDGDVDIVTLNRNTATVSIFKSRGIGAGYELPLVCPVGPGPFSLVIDSLNTDAFMDLAVSNFAEGTLSLLLNHGSGTFPIESLKVVGINPRGAAAVDLDGDGDRDMATLICVADTDRTVGINAIVLVYNENGNFNDSGRVIYRITDSLPNPWELTAADFNGDGRQDLAFSLSSTSLRAEVCVLLNNGNPTLPFGNDLNSPDTKSCYPAGDSCQSLAALDVDRDGDIDLVAASLVGNIISIFKNDGSGNFAPRVNFGCPTRPSSIAAGDFDGDLDIDLAVTSRTGHSMGVMLNNGSGAFPTGAFYPTGSGFFPRGLTAADLDADGDLDLAATLFQPRNRLQVFRNDSSLGFVGLPVFGTNALNSPRVLAAADIDGDADFDLVVGNQGGDSVGIFRNNGNATFAAGVYYRAGKFVYSLLVRDMDSDGDSDIATANAGANSVSVLKNDGTGLFGIKQDFPVGFLPNSITAADLDMDGDLDLAVSEQGSGGSLDFVSVLFNDGTGNFPTRNSYPVGSAPSAIRAAQIDGDGDFDLLVTNAGDGETPDASLMVLKNNGAGSFAPPARYETAPAPLVIQAVDLDLDGDLDVVTADTSDVLTIFYNDGSGNFPLRIDYGCGFGPVNVITADWDRDGDFDLTVANSRSVTPNVGGFTILKNLAVLPCGVRGDLNLDGSLTPVDVILILNCVYSGTSSCPSCGGDVNCDGVIGPVDVTLLLLRVFAGAPLPC